MEWVDPFGLTNNLPDHIFSSKAPNQTNPGVRTLEGQHINNLGRVEPWRSHYDEYGRMIERTDYNAGNLKDNIPDTHYHEYEYRQGANCHEVRSHIPGEFPI